MTSLVGPLNLGDARQLGALLALLGAVVVYARHARDPLSKIPTVGGPDFPVLSFWSTLQFMLRGRKIVREGYAKHRGGAFKIATLDRWWVMLTGDALANEVRRAPDDAFSVTHASNALLNTEYSMSKLIAHTSWHIDPVRTTLTKNMDAVFPAVFEEIAAAFDEYIPASDSEWATLVANPLVQKVVARASNRMFLGLPYCRDPKVVKVGVEVAWDATLNIFISQLFPSPLKFLVGYISPLPAKTKVLRTVLDPVITERREKLQREKEGHEYEDKPNDYLMWLLENPEGQKVDLQDLGTRMLIMNFAAIHSTSMVTLHVLYTLAVNPEHVTTLREEIKDVVAEHGWSRLAISEMFKLDSYIKEVSRVTAFLGTTMIRMAMKPYTFSDGTFIPEGTIVGVPIPPAHADDDVYPDAGTFDPWRFLAQEKGGAPFTTTSPEWLFWGGGRHACPGRFFAGNEIKTILAYIVWNYDVETEVKGVRPKDLVIGTESLPNGTAKLRFRKRKV